MVERAAAIRSARLAQVLTLADQLQRAQRLGHGELRLRQRLGGRLWIAAEIERFDGHDVSLDREGAEQQLGELAGLLGVGVRPSALGDIARDAGQGAPGALHDLIDVGRRREEPGEVAHRELDAIENFGKRREVAQLGQATKRLHAADDIVQRLPVARGGAQRPSGPVERARDQGAFTRHECPDAGVQLRPLGPRGGAPARWPRFGRPGSRAPGRAVRRARCRPRPTRRPGGPAGEILPPPAPPAPGWPHPRVADARDARGRPPPARPRPGQCESGPP